MITLGAYEKCKRYIELHSGTSEDSEPVKKTEVYPCITLSRETGAGADLVAQELVKYLTKYKLEDDEEWTFFDRNLIEKILQDHKLPKRTAEYLHEDKHNLLSDAINEVLGIHPSSWTLLQKTMGTILRIARTGKVIIVGRGANIITAKLPNTFHVRLIAPLENRIKHVQEVYNLTYSEAVEFTKREDQARKNFVKTNFFKEIDDPLLYHMIINTGWIPHNEAAKIIGDTVVNRFKKVMETV